MAIEERDPHSGHMTTGHEWNGIKELNTPVPKPVWFFLIVTVLVSIGCWIALPAWPTGLSYTKGMLGADDRREVVEQRRESAVGRSGWLRQVEATEHEQLLADPEAVGRVRTEGARLFGDNCAVCHGADGRGIKGFPNLADRDWLWGGTPDAIEETIRVGVNSTHDDTRVSEMLAFGADGLLDAAQVTAASDYVVSLSNPAVARAKPNSVRAGRAVFETNCAVCHGPEGRGNQTLGVPNLADPSWINGGDWASVYTIISGGRKGEMPAWQDRLTAAERKLLTVYVLDLGRNPQ